MTGIGPHAIAMVIIACMLGWLLAASGCVSGRSLCCFGPPPCFGYDNCSIPGVAPTTDPQDASANVTTPATFQAAEATQRF